jgi:hypothetical protein
VNSSPGWLVVAVGRVAAAFLETVFVAAATYGIVSVFVPLRIDWNAAALLPLLMGVLAAVGVSLMVAGGTLVWKRIQLVNDAVLVVVMIFSASALPLISVPGWWVSISHFLPLTDVIGSLYRSLFIDQPVLVAWGMGGLVPLVAASLDYLATGSRRSCSASGSRSAAARSAATRMGKSKGCGPVWRPWNSRRVSRVGVATALKLWRLSWTPTWTPLPLHST